MIAQRRSWTSAFTLLEIPPAREIQATKEKIVHDLETFWVSFHDLRKKVFPIQLGRFRRQRHWSRLNCQEWDKCLPLCL
jgi:hypothetical protein